MKKIFCSLVIFYSFILNIYSEESIDDSKEELTSITEDRRQTLLYGIDTEVKELIGILSKEEILGFDKELAELLSSTYDETIKIAILEYFKKLEITAGEKTALEIFDLIEYEDEYTTKYAQTTLSYLSKIESNEAKARISDIIDSEKDEIVISSLKLIGENKLVSLEDKLISMLNDDETEELVYLEVIKTLGKIGSIKALDDLIPIADDSDEETTIRNAVCFSLGEIGDPKGIDVLKRCFGDRTNFLLRRSALEALGKFDLEEMDGILIEGLRDPNWQIRFSATKSLGERKSEKAIDILKYKAEKDPEAKIKKSAIRALGDIDTEKTRDILRDLYLGKKTPDSSKIVAIQKLVEYSPGWILPTIESEYERLLEEKRKPVLDNSIKFLSKKEFSGSKEFFGKLLESENYLYKVYAIQAIKLNSFVKYKEKLEELSKEDKNKNVKKQALSALEEL